MKLAIIGDRGIPAKYSGFSTLVEQMATRMVAEYGFEVTVYCRSNYYDSKPPLYNGVKCVYLPAPGGKSLESIVHSNIAILHAAFCSYDVVLVLDPGNGPFVLPLRVRGHPVIIHTDGMGWKRQKWSPLQQRYYKWSEKISALFAHWLVTDSKAMQDYYVEEYKSKSSFIPYAGEVGDHSDESILKEFGLTKGEYYLCVARIEPDNNIDVIIREYRKAKSTKPLIVVGDARYDTPYGRAIAAEDDEIVHCIGSIYQKNKLNALFENSYVYLHGHEVGGTNPSLLNAMHMSAAPVAMDVIFHRQVMTDDGMFFSKRDNHLASIIQELDNDPEKVSALRILAKSRSDSLYRWDAVVDGYVKMAQLVLKNYKSKAALHDALAKEVYEPLKFFNKEKE
ncbi:MAG: glycosyltransferase involved in cell wall biosynthesis [Halioglobus sp.]|jgi:glycosyltransferase involved in cell wall biosynthesis